MSSPAGIEHPSSCFSQPGSATSRRAARYGLRRAVVLPIGLLYVVGLAIPSALQRPGKQQNPRPRMFCVICYFPKSTTSSTLDHIPIMICLVSRSLTGKPATYIPTLFDLS